MNHWHGQVLLTACVSVLVLFVGNDSGKVSTGVEIRSSEEEEWTRSVELERLRKIPDDKRQVIFVGEVVRLRADCSENGGLVPQLSIRVDEAIAGSEVGDEFVTKPLSAIIMPEDVLADCNQIDQPTAIVYHGSPDQFPILIPGDKIVCVGWASRSSENLFYMSLVRFHSGDDKALEVQVAWKRLAEADSSIQRSGAGRYVHRDFAVSGLRISEIRALAKD